MRYQDQVVKVTYKALDDVCRAAMALPAEHQSWAPQGHARSALDQMREIATQAQLFLPLIRDRAVPDFTGHAMRETMRLRQSFATVEECAEAARADLASLSAAIATVPDSVLEMELDLPFGGGMRMTMADIVMLPYWNLVYHLGQINFLQLMLGDREMH